MIFSHQEDVGEAARPADGSTNEDRSQARQRYRWLPLLAHPPRAGWLQLSDGRFSLGLGTEENLSEHVAGRS